MWTESYFSKENTPCFLSPINYILGLSAKLPGPMLAFITLRRKEVNSYRSLPTTLQKTPGTHGCTRSEPLLSWAFIIPEQSTCTDHHSSGARATTPVENPKSLWKWPKARQGRVCKCFSFGRKTPHHNCRKC